jgi:hypothetical protein
MLAARGDAESALCRLQEALAIFLRLGARKDSERTERALAALGPVPARTAAVSRDQPS